MPVEASGVWNLLCPGCGDACSVRLETLPWRYKNSFEPSMVMLTCYHAAAACSACSAALPVELEFSSTGRDFENPVLWVGGQRLRPVQARCDGKEYWAEVDREMSAEDFRYLGQAQWPSGERDRLLSGWRDGGPLRLFVAGSDRLYLRTPGHWWESRNGGADWTCLEEFLDGWLTRQIQFWKEL